MPFVHVAFVAILSALVLQFLGRLKVDVLPVAFLLTLTIAAVSARA